MELIDDAFYIKKQSWGTWDSLDKDGNKLVTSHTEQNCIDATRYYLQYLQEKTNGTD